MTSAVQTFDMRADVYSVQAITSWLRFTSHHRLRGLRVGLSMATYAPLCENDSHWLILQKRRERSSVYGNLVGSRPAVTPQLTHENNSGSANIPIFWGSVSISWNFYQDFKIWIRSKISRELQSREFSLKNEFSEFFFRSSSVL